MSAPDVVGPYWGELTGLGETHTHLAHMDGDVFRTMPHYCVDNFNLMHMVRTHRLV